MGVRVPERVLHLLLILLIFVGLLASSSHLLCGLNSDSLYLVTFYRDLFVDHYSILGWNLTPAPYFFPDMMLFSLMLFLAGDVGFEFALYSIVFFGFFWLF